MLYFTVGVLDTVRINAGLRARIEQEGPHDIGRSI